MLSKFTFLILSILFSKATAGLLFAEVVSTLPRDVPHVALDETLGHYVAYRRDGTLYGRYVAADLPVRTYEKRQSGASGCTNLTVDEAKTLPGWNTITKYADDTWGTGSRNIVTNPPDYPGSPAEVCVSSETVEISFSGNPTCQVNNVTSEGKLVGTNGTVYLSVQQGSNITNSFTVTTSSTIGVSSTTSVTMGFPEIADVEESVTFSVEVTNTQTKGFSKTLTSLVGTGFTMDSVEGKTCNAVESVKTCTLQGTGRIRYLATGWIWFNYDSTTKGHYKWAASIDSILTNQDDRSSFLDFQGSVVSDTHSSYFGECD